jgi:hypothetical protein
MVNINTIIKPQHKCGFWGRPRRSQVEWWYLAQETPETAHEWWSLAQVTPETAGRSRGFPGQRPSRVCFCSLRNHTSVVLYLSHATKLPNYRKTTFNSGIPHAKFAMTSRWRYAVGATTSRRPLRVTFSWHMRQIHAGCASHPRIRRKCCAHLPREERATRDVTFGPLCISLHALCPILFESTTNW